MEEIIWNPNYDADGCTTNEERARRAHAIVLAYVVERDEMPSAWVDFDVADAITDLLADLMHLCDRETLLFDPFLDSARIHHQAERGPAPGAAKEGSAATVGLHEDEGG